MQILVFKNNVCVTPRRFRVWWMYVYFLDDSLLKYKFPTTHRDLKQHKIDVLNHNITKNLHPINNKIKIP